MFQKCPAGIMINIAMDMKLIKMWNHKVLDRKKAFKADTYRMCH